MYSLYEERTDPTEKVTPGPVNSDIFADQVPVDPALMHETAMGGTLAAIEPMNEPVVDEIPLVETPLQEIPMGGTVAAVGPMNDELRNEAIPLYATTVQPTPMGETVAAGPMYGPGADELPMGEPVAAVRPMNSEMVADSIPMYETPVKEITLVETPAVIDTVPYQAPTPLTAPSSTPVLNSEESEHFRIHWNEIQGKFVDDPRTAVLQADALVSEVIAQVAETFAKERGTLEGKWKQNNDVSTEELRKALQLYRSFFNRLVV